jgi:hypothetical protein
MDLQKKFGTDHDLEAEAGIDIDFGDGAVVTIRRAGGANKKYSNTARRVFKPHRQQIEADTISEEKLVGLLARIYAEAVILDWRGVTIGGKEVPFEREAVIEALVAFPEFFNAIRNEAESAAAFRREELEADAKN